MHVQAYVHTYLKYSAPSSRNLLMVAMASSLSVRWAKMMVLLSECVVMMMLLGRVLGWFRRSTATTSLIGITIHTRSTICAAIE